jgi:adenylate kinase
MRVCVTGIPGSGKTTLAAALAARFDVPLVSTGDIAREVDPESVARGEMADRVKIHYALQHRLVGLPSFILDGAPREIGELPVIPPNSKVILLTTRRDIARDRLLRRGRADDLPDIIDRRIDEQAKLLNGWAYELAGWHQTVNTSLKPASQIAQDVTAYLLGDKRECH